MGLVVTESVTGDPELKENPQGSWNPAPGIQLLALPRNKATTVVVVADTG